MLAPFLSADLFGPTYTELTKTRGDILAGVERADLFVDVGDFAIAVNIERPARRVTGCAEDAISDSGNFVRVTEDWEICSVDPGELSVRRKVIGTRHIVGGVESAALRHSHGVTCTRPFSRR